MPATASRPRRLLLCLLVVTTLATAAFTATASAAATPVPFSTPPETNVYPADPQPCTGVPGTLTVTDSMQGLEVFNADGTFHVSATVTQDIREDWIDGTYLIAEIVGPASFNVNPTGNQTFSGAAKQVGTLYSATGQILGPFDTVGEFHYTYVDGNFVSSSFRVKITSSPC
jgi:hypothetical protein